MNEKGLHNSKGMTITQERLDMWCRSFGKTFSINISQITGADDKSKGTIVKMVLPVITS